MFILVDSDKSADKPGINNARDMVLAFGLTFLLAGLSYRYIERPFIKGRWPGWKLFAGLGAGIAISLALLLYANTVRAPKAADRRAAGPAPRPRPWRSAGVCSHQPGRQRPGEDPGGRRLDHGPGRAAP